MSVSINRYTRVLMQGITSKNGTFHIEQTIAYGTQIVDGVTPGKGGQRHLGRPIFNSMKETMSRTEANASAIYVPIPFMLDSAVETIEADVELAIAIIEGVPTLDMVEIRRLPDCHPDVRLIGPNRLGVITPGECRIGIMPDEVHRPGRIGIVSRSGTLIYEAVAQATALGFGQPTYIGTGGDPVPETNFIDALRLFKSDPQIDAVIIIGEIGGNAGERAAEFTRHEVNKPVVGHIVSVTAPKEKRMGHVGTIISGGSGSAKDKFRAFDEAGMIWARNPALSGETLRNVIK